MSATMSKFSSVGLLMVAAAGLIAFGLADAGSDIFPEWFVPVGAGAIVVGASLTARSRAHREMVVIVALAVMVSAGVEARIVKSSVLALAGVAVVLLDRRRPKESQPPSLMPSWALWALAVGIVALVLLLP